MWEDIQVRTGRRKDYRRKKIPQAQVIQAICSTVVAHETHNHTVECPQPVGSNRVALTHAPMPQLI